MTVEELMRQLEKLPKETRIDTIVNLDCSEDDSFDIVGCELELMRTDCAEEDGYVELLVTRKNENPHVRIFRFLLNEEKNGTLESQTGYRLDVALLDDDLVATRLYPRLDEDGKVTYSYNVLCVDMNGKNPVTYDDSEISQREEEKFCKALGI